MSANIEQSYYELVEIFGHWNFNSADEQHHLTRIIDLIPTDAVSVLDVALRSWRKRGAVLPRAGWSALPTLPQSVPVRNRPRLSRQTAVADGAFDVVTALQVIEHLPYRVYETAVSIITCAVLSARP